MQAVSLTAPGRRRASWTTPAATRLASLFRGRARGPTTMQPRPTFTLLLHSSARRRRSATPSRSPPSAPAPTRRRQLPCHRGQLKAGETTTMVVADGHGQVRRSPIPTAIPPSACAEITGVTLAETGFNGSGTAPSPVYDLGDTDADGRLDPGETWVYRASYTLVAADPTRARPKPGNGQRRRTGGTPVSDLSGQPQSCRRQRHRHARDPAPTTTM